MLRVRDMDDAYAGIVQASVEKLTEVLQLPVSQYSPKLLNPILKAVALIEKRFHRPEQINVNHKVKAVAIVGSPVDFQEAMKAKGEANAK